MTRLGTALALALTGVAFDAHALGRLADVEIVDRTTGAALETHYYRGEYWVAGTPGGRYAISIHNHLGERLLAVTAVDGVNVISGDTAGWQQTGYVFGPFQGYEISGWRKSNHVVATFEFTASPNSYAERTGRPANVGVIGVALFRERHPEPPPVAYQAPFAPGRDVPLAGAAPAAAADAVDARAERRATFGAPTEESLAARAPAKLGTGHGARETSDVEDTEFDRASANPGEVIRIRYDSLANLVAMGVISGRPPLPPRPNAFPDSPARYVPDPPGYSSGGLR
jgi:hypothetical protein